MHMYVRTADVVRGTLWQVFPPINVDRVADIPADYPGPMGVPITFLDRHNPDQFEIIGRRGHLALPDGRQPYQRIIVRNLRPALPEVIDIAAMLEDMGVPVEITFMGGGDKLPEDFRAHYRAPEKARILGF